MNDSEYIFAEVNKLLEKNKQAIATDYAIHWENLQKYIESALRPSLDQAAEIDAKNRERWVESEAVNKIRFEAEKCRIEEAQKQSIINIRTQNACMLLAAGYTNETAVNAVLKIENLFRDKKNNSTHMCS